MTARYVLVSSFALLLVASSAVADDVRYTVGDDGRTYLETKKIERRPFSETRIEERQRTVYREQYVTESQDQYRTVLTPVTEYQWQSQWRGRWNPFQQPYIEHRLIPSTRWNAHTEVVNVPVTRRELVPETQVTQVPVTVREMRDHEVTTRVAVNPPDTSSASGTTVARRPIGGVSNLQNDPPRYGTDWRPSTTVVRR